MNSSVALPSLAIEARW